MTHELKILKQYADAVLSGEKPFEVRENDRGFQKGDTVVFTVIDRLKLTISHPLNGVPFEITYLLHGWGLKDGWCVFGIRRADNG